MELSPTLHTCVLSGKPIRQKHIDKELVTDYGKGKALIKAVQNTILNPPDNPVVFSAKEVSVVTIAFSEFNFPKRVVLKDRVYKKLPQLIYIQNQEFKLFRQIPTGITEEIGFGETQDGCTFKGIAFYKKTFAKTRVDKEEKK